MKLFTLLIVTFPFMIVVVSLILFVVKRRI